MLGALALAPLVPQRMVMVDVLSVADGRQNLLALTELIAAGKIVVTV